MDVFREFEALRDNYKDGQSEVKSWETLTQAHSLGKYAANKERLDEMQLGLSRTQNEEEMQKLLHEFKEHDASRNTRSIKEQQQSLNLDKTDQN